MPSVGDEVTTSSAPLRRWHPRPGNSLRPVGGRRALGALGLRELVACLRSAEDAPERRCAGDFLGTDQQSATSSTGWLTGCYTRRTVGWEEREVIVTSMQLTRAVEAKDLLKAFKTFGIAQTDVAAVTCVDAKTVYTWKKGARPRAGAYDRLDGLREVVQVLSDSLTDRGVGQWLRARNRVLAGRRPLDVLRDGGHDQVLAAAHSFVDGAYV